MRLPSLGATLWDVLVGRPVADDDYDPERVMHVADDDESYYGGTRVLRLRVRRRRVVAPVGVHGPGLPGLCGRTRLRAG